MSPGDCRRFVHLRGRSPLHVARLTDLAVNMIALNRDDAQNEQSGTGLNAMLVIINLDFGNQL
jgi:hypothetical protein